MKKFILSTVIIAFAISCLVTSCSQDDDWGMDEYSTLAGQKMTRSPESNDQMLTYTQTRDITYEFDDSYSATLKTLFEFCTNNNFDSISCKTSLITVASSAINVSTYSILHSHPDSAGHFTIIVKVKAEGNLPNPAFVEEQFRLNKSTFH